MLLQMPGERFLIQCPIEKKNNWGVWQERRLVITDQAIYNVKDCTQIQRKIKLSSIRALSRGTSLQGLLQFVIHVNDEYDYHLRALSADDFTLVIVQLETVYVRYCAGQLPIYLVPEELEDFMTTKEKARDGDFVLPPSKWLLKREEPN